MTEFIVPKSPGIYIIKNTKNGKIYLGQTNNLHRRWQSHRQRLTRGIHSNPHLQAAWNKYGEKAFKFLILERCEVDRLDEREQHYLNVHATQDNCYNIATDASAPMRGQTHTPEARAKISKAGKGRVVNEETRRKIAEAQSGAKSYWYGKHNPSGSRPRTEAEKQHLRELNLGNHHTPETCAKMSASRTGEGNHFFGKKHSEESRQKMSEAVRNRPPPSEEARQKMSKTHLGNKYNLGRKPTPETLKKLSNAKIGKLKSAETRARMSEAQKKRRETERERLSRDALESSGLSEDTTI